MATDLRHHAILVENLLKGLGLRFQKLPLEELLLRFEAHEKTLQVRRHLRDPSDGKNLRVRIANWANVRRLVAGTAQ